MPPSLYVESSGRSNTESNLTKCEVVTCAMPGVVTNSMSRPSSLKNPSSRATSTGKSCTAFMVATWGRVLVAVLMRLLLAGPVYCNCCSLQKNKEHGAQRNELRDPPLAGDGA